MWIADVAAQHNQHMESNSKEFSKGHNSLRRITREVEGLLIASYDVNAV